MKNKVFFVLCAASLNLMLSWSAHAALAAGMAAQVVSLQGAGEQRQTSGDAWTAAKTAMLLPGGAFVRTLPASKMALLFADDTQVRLNQNSVLQVKPNSSATQDTTLLLSLGRAWAQTKRAPDSRLNFETPAATAGIRGTDWELEVDASGKTMLTVFSGSVDFFNAQGRLQVASNEAAVAEIGKAPVKILLSNPRERIQWVNALSADPLRHLDAEQVPPQLQTTLAALNRADLGAARAALATAQAAPSVWLAVFHSALTILAGDVASAQPQLARQTGQADALPAAYLMLSDVQLVAGESAQAAVTLQAGLVKWPGQTDLLAQLARAQMLADMLSDSEKTLAQASPPDTPSLLLAQGELARRQGRTAATLQAFTRATQRMPTDDRGWYGLGSAQNELEQSNAARVNIGRALTLKPEGAGYQGELGMLETFANDFPKADLAFSNALMQNPADYVALTGLGLLRLKQGQPQEALDAFLRAGLMEPRYARAKTYTAAAYYQLGRHRDAMDTLQQAVALDNKDPIPHLFLSQIYTDLQRPGEAVQASREAVKRLPYLKSLNQLANDQKGSANFGAALAFFGLEDWAQELAQRSYSPYWGGSHLFLADRYPGEFNKNSELFQGFLSDPLAFGASNRFSSLLQRSGHYGTAEFNYDKTLSELSMPSVSVNGLANSRTPIAYFAQVQRGRAHGFPIDVGVSANLPLFEDSSGRADVDATVTTLGLGLKPTENLGVFVYHNAFKVKLQGHNAVLVPGELDFFEPTSTVFDVNIQQSALGFSYRWSPTSQTWLKFGRSQAVNDVSAFPVVFVTESSLGLLGLYAKPDKKFDDIQLQHTQDLSEATRISVGLEHVKETQYSEVLGVGPLALASNGQLTLSDYVVFGGRNDIGRDFTAMTLSARHQASSSVLLDASLTANQLREKVDGQNELVSVANETVKPTQVLTDQRFNSWAPRLGVVYQPNDALSIRAAYQDWVRPLSVSSLNSVQTAGIALEDRLVEAGGRLKRSVVQMGLTLGDSTHLTAKFDHQKIHNPVAPGVDLRTPSLPFLEALRNAQNVNLSTLDVLEDTPSLEDASLNAVSFGINRLLTPSLSGHAKYTLQESSSSYAESDEPSGRVQGKRIAYLPRNTLALGATWANGQRLLLGGRATYRSDRFEDMQNLTLWPASWSVDLLAFWETKDKRWSLTAAALNLGGNKSVRQSERYVVDARYRF